jgi:Flp pilus assembly pilin Flp
MRTRRRQAGQSLVEYVALTALVAIVSIGTVKVFGGKVRSRLNQITNTFDRNVQQGLKSRSHKGSQSEDDDDDGDSDEGGGGRGRGKRFPALPRIPLPW